MNRKELQNQPLQLYSYLTHPGENSNALAIRPSLKTKENFSLCIGACHVPHNSTPELIEFFIGGLLHGATLFAVHQSIRKLKKRFPNRRHAINFIGNMVKNYIRQSLFNLPSLLPFIECKPSLLPFTFINCEEPNALVSTSGLVHYANRLSYYADHLAHYSSLALPAVLITALRGEIKNRFREGAIIQVFASLVLFLSALALVYTNDDSDNPVQVIAEYALKFLSSLATEFLLTCWENPTEILLQAIQHDYQAIVKLILAAGTNVNATTNSSILSTPLHLAVYCNRGEIVSQLLAAGSNVNVTNSVGGTPLHLAAHRNHQKITEALLAAGANINAANIIGLTPLHLAVRHNRQKTISQLLAAGANVNATSIFGTPFHFLARNNILLGTKELLIKTTVLKNPTMAKPNFIETNRELSNIWNACMVEIEKLRSKGSSGLSLWSFFIEKNINKLAPMSKNKEVQLRANEANFLKKHPYFGRQFQVILEKGMHRNKTLTTALNSIYIYNKNARLNEDLWGNILEYLDEKSLKNTTQVASLFFKKSASPPSKQYETSYNGYNAPFTCN